MKYLRQSPYYSLEGLTGQFESFAQGYNCNAYGEGNYGECATTASGSSSDGLVDTGVAVGLFAGIAALLVFMTVLVMVMRRKGKGQKQSSQAAVPASPVAPKSLRPELTSQQPVQSRPNTDIINDRKG